MVVLIVLFVIVATFGLMLLSEKMENVPWERKVSIGSDEVYVDVNDIDWDSVEPDKTYAFWNSLGVETEGEDDEWLWELD